MSIRTRVSSLLRNLVLRKRVEQDLDDELRSYLEMAAEERRGAGLSDDEARRTALVELGGIEQVRESVRDARTGALVDQLRQDLRYARRFVLVLFAIFAGLAVLLAAVGTYGVMSYAVADRTREIGIRVALGAGHSTVLRQVMSDVVGLTFAGLIIGTLAARILVPLMTSLLFDVSPGDVVTYVAVSCVLGAVAILAGYAPARRAATVDPLVALRQE